MAGGYVPAGASNSEKKCPVGPWDPLPGAALSNIVWGYCDADSASADPTTGWVCVNKVEGGTIGTTGYDPGNPY